MRNCRRGCEVLSRMASLRARPFGTPILLRTSHPRTTSRLCRTSLCRAARLPGDALKGALHWRQTHLCLLSNGWVVCQACPQASWRPASQGRVRDVLVKIISFGAHLEHDDLGELRTSPRRHAVVRELDRVIHGNVHDAKQACGSVNLTVNEVSVRQVSVLVGVRITDAERLVITSFSDGLSQHRGLKRSPHVDADAGADHCKKPHWCLLRDRLEHVAAVSDLGPLVVSERPADLVRWAMNPQTRAHEKVVRRIGKRNNSILIIDRSRAAR